MIVKFVVFCCIKGSMIIVAVAIKISKLRLIQQLMKVKFKILNQ